MPQELKKRARIDMELIKTWEAEHTMKKCANGIGLALLLMILSISAVQARTGYVSDMLILTFREGPGTTYSVLKTLRSNTPLTVLEEDQGFYKVALESGEQGWVDKQFVVFDLPKSMVIDQLNQEKAALENQLEILMKTSGQFKNELAAQKSAAGQATAALEEEIAGLKKENAGMAAQLNQTRSELERLRAASEDVVATLEANKQLTAENRQLSQNLAQVEQDASQIFKTSMIKWFLAGVGVLLLGWIIGMMISPKRRRRNSLLD